MGMPAQEDTHYASHPQVTKFSQSQIDRFMSVPPPPEQLSEGNPVETPVGIWRQEGVEVIFYPVQQNIIDEMTKPDIRTRGRVIWERAKNAVKKYGALD